MNRAIVKKIDTAFSKFIRTRDDQGGVFLCCSCRQMKPSSQMDAGHFINRRWLATRWREDNVHGQCRSCNRFDEGNAVGYTRFMLSKYGESHVDYLESLKNATMKYTDGEGLILLAEYKRKLKELTKNKKDV